jgi:hypothetical protein
VKKITRLTTKSENARKSRSNERSPTTRRTIRLTAKREVNADLPEDEQLQGRGN